MASIFTWDPNPPKVASPWLIPTDSGKSKNGDTVKSKPGSAPHAGLLSDYGVTKLRAEPEDGPTEYKLHLLLRPRRAYKSMTTASRSVGSYAGRPREPTSDGTHAAASQPRQQRLLQLTTQLLWRLQQSSPYHVSSSKEITLPRLPGDDIDLERAKSPASLLPGLEESRGALYEIGVSDDGTLVGLTKDEMDESIKTLRVMAASLGCSVEVLRMVIVGDCEWFDTLGPEKTEVPREAPLWVAEALVTPDLGGEHRHGDEAENNKAGSTSASTKPRQEEAMVVPHTGKSGTPQLRVTFTGPTTSGKSSLLGTLSTGALDNGRGKSRLNLLKHRHEVVSGITSSIAQELIGYKGQDILNFAQRNIESWIDIHACAEGGRLVFVSDSGGHPRYRRTVLRGLMNWAPHWSVLCIAGDDKELEQDKQGATPGADNVPAAVAANGAFVRAHLDLSLKLNVPMAIVVTKMDLASKSSVQRTMSKILSAIKDAGRVPKIVQPDAKGHAGLLRIPDEDLTKIRGVVSSITECGDLTKYVPIVLTSSVKGTGIGLLHALLQSLPMPPTPTSDDFVGMALNPEQPKVLFHVDDTFTLPASYSIPASNAAAKRDRGIVVSGHLRFGNLSVGDSIVVGPFPPEDDEARVFAPEDKASPGNYGLSISHPSSAELAKVAMKNAVSASTIAGEWHTAEIVSIRNLRLPVRTLESGQAGTIGLILKNTSTAGQEGGECVLQDSPRIRRGMVLAIPSKHMVDTGLSLQAASGFTATFKDPDINSLAVGAFVNVYVASVRATARVRGISHHRRDAAAGPGAAEDDIDVFALNDEPEQGVTGGAEGPKFGAEVFLELLHNREWVELGSPVILLEGGSQDKTGLEGYVGRIIEIVE